MTNIKIEIFDLNNSPIFPSGRIDGVESFVITYKEDDDKNIITSSYSSELVFYDDGYQLIYNSLIANPIGFSQKLKVNIYDTCCNELVYTGYIKGDSIDWCEDKCSVTCNIIFEDDSESCVKNTLIWDDPAFISANYNRIDYCIENRPNFIQVLLYIIGGLILPVILAVLGPIIAFLYIIGGIVYGICQLINVFGNVNCDGVEPGDLGGAGVINAANEITDALVPCQSYHNAPYLHQYLNNACNLCGLNFKSSILNDPNDPIGSIYYDTVLFAIEVHKGRDATSSLNNMYADNFPVETLHTLFRDYLNPLFNGKWRIVGNDFVFERKDYFYTNAEWINADTLLANGKIVDNAICWSWIDKERYAYGRYGYTMDAMEYIGNEAKNQYGDIVEWNPTGDPSQKGEYSMISQFAPTRTVDDQYGSFYVSWVFAGGGNLPGIYGQLVMAQETAFNYKIFVYSGDNKSPVKGSKSSGGVPGVYNDNFISFTGNPSPPNEVLSIPLDERINYPYWFVEGIQGVSGAQNNLYSLFHYIDDPRQPGSRQFNFNFKYRFDCGEFRNFSFDKYVTLTRGNQTLNGKVTELEVDFNRRVIQVKGIA